MSRSIASGLHPGFGFLPLKVGEVHRLWTPLNDPGLQLFLDVADPSSVTTSGSGVSLVEDKSPFNRDFTQSVNSNRPTYGVATANGLNLMSFSSQFLRRDESWMWEQGQQAVVAIVQGGPQTDRRVIASGSSTNNFPIYSLLQTRSTVTSSQVAAYIRADDSTELVDNEVARGSAFNGSLNIVITIDTGSSIIVRVNGTQTNSEFYVRAGTLTMNRTAIGALLRASAAVFYTGDLGDIVSTSSIGIGTIQRHEGVAAHKWGIASKLPNDHPYKNNPPTV